MEALPNVEGSLLGVILFRPTDERIQGSSASQSCDSSSVLETLINLQEVRIAHKNRRCENLEPQIC